MNGIKKMTKQDTDTINANSALSLPYRLLLLTTTDIIAIDRISINISVIITSLPSHIYGRCPTALGGLRGTTRESLCF